LNHLKSRFARLTPKVLIWMQNLP